MANYSSYKVYIKQIAGTFDVETIKENVRQLQKDNIIFYDAKVYICLDELSLELRYSAKWFPEIDEIFLPDEYDIWVIHADEGGAKDTVKYMPADKSRIEEIDYKSALYEFDEIEMYGDVEEIDKNLSKIFGVYNGYHHKNKIFLTLYLEGFYTASNYVCDYNREEICFEFVDSLPLIDEFSECEFRHMMWENHHVVFFEDFYCKIFNKKGKNLFPYIEAIKFKYKGRLTNVIERVEDDEWSDWRHTASNNFHNLINTNFIRFMKDS